MTWNDPSVDPEAAHGPCSRCFGWHPSRSRCDDGPYTDIDTLSRTGHRRIMGLYQPPHQRPRAFGGRRPGWLVVGAALSVGMWVGLFWLVTHWPWA